MLEALMAPKGASAHDKQAAQSPGPDTPKVPSAVLLSVFAAGQPHLPMSMLHHKSIASAAAASPSIQPQVPQQISTSDNAVGAAKPRCARKTVRTCSVQDGTAEVHGDTWRGAIPWRILYPTKVLPANEPPQSSTAPSSGQTTMHKEPAGTIPTHVESRIEVQYTGDDLQYNPMLVDLIRNINHSNKLKKAAVTAAVSAAARWEPRAACTSRQTTAGTPVAAPASHNPALPAATPSLPALRTCSTPAALGAPATGNSLQPQQIAPALRATLRRLNKLQKYDNLYTAEEGGERTLQAMFGPGVPIWRMVEDLEITRKVSAADRLYLLGSSTDQGAKRRHLMLLLQPLVGEYVVQHRKAAKPGTALHKFASYKLKQPQLTLAEAARYNSPCAEFMQGCNLEFSDEDYGEEICSYGTGCSWSAQPSQAVYTYQVMPEKYDKLMGRK